MCALEMGRDQRRMRHERTRHAGEVVAQIAVEALGVERLATRAEVRQQHLCRQREPHGREGERVDAAPMPAAVVVGVRLDEQDRAEPEDR